MERLTNDLGLIRGSFNFEAVKEPLNVLKKESMKYLREQVGKEM